MALGRSISMSGKEDSGSSGPSFRRSMTFKAEEHADSRTRSMNFVGGNRLKKPTTRKHQNSGSGSQLATVTESELKQLKFKTDLPDRIIRQSLAVFQDFDIDSNGFIEKSEFRDTLDTMGISTTDAQLKRLMDAFDTNKDTKISHEEFLKMVKKIGLYNQRDDIEENNEERENIACAFVALGGNSNFTGTVSCAKMRDMVDAFDLDLDVDALLALLETDAEGTLNYQEFSSLFGASKIERKLTEEVVNTIAEDLNDN